MTTGGGSLAHRHQLVAAALLAAAGQTLPDTPNPYLVHHLAAHIAEAGTSQIEISTGNFPAGSYVVRVGSESRSLVISR